MKNKLLIIFLATLPLNLFASEPIGEGPSLLETIKKAKGLSVLDLPSGMTWQGALKTLSACDLDVRFTVVPTITDACTPTPGASIAESNAILDWLSKNAAEINANFGLLKTMKPHESDHNKAKFAALSCYSYLATIIRDSLQGRVLKRTANVLPPKK